jgi:cold shock protein
MAVGKVVKFDQARGFGFIAPTGGGEDVFLHVNDLLMSESEVRPGVTVEFDVDDGGRGLKGSNIRLVNGAPGVPAVDPQPRAIPGPLAPGSLASGSLAPSLVAATAKDNDLCDVLTPGEFSSQITELLLTGIPTLTGGQVLEARRLLLSFSEARGWVSP